MIRQTIALFFLLLIGELSTQLYGQTMASGFHGCPRHCGVYPDEGKAYFQKLLFKAKTKGKVFSSATIAEKKLFIGSEDGYLRAIDKKSGKLRWQFKTNGAIHSTPAWHQNTVYVNSMDGYVYAVEATSGEEKWRFKTEGEQWPGGVGYWGMKPDTMFMRDPWEFFLSSPIVDETSGNATVYVGSGDSHVYAIDGVTGALRWKFKTDGIVHSTPALYDGKVYVGSWDATLYALDAATGELRWKFVTGKQMGMTGIQASPSVENGVIYFGARDAYFYALDAATGALKWKYFADNSWIINTSAIRDGIVYTGTSDSFLVIALDARNGKEIWKTKLHGYVYSSPAIAGETLYVGDFTGRIYTLNRKTGERLHDFSTPGFKLRAEAVLDASTTMDYMKLAEGKDQSLYNATIEVMDQLYTLGPIVSSPIVVDGIIYFGSADGNIYAVQLGDQHKPSKKNPQL